MPWTSNLQPVYFPDGTAAGGADGCGAGGETAGLDVGLGGGGGGSAFDGTAKLPFDSLSGLVGIVRFFSLSE